MARELTLQSWLLIVGRYELGITKKAAAMTLKQRATPSVSMSRLQSNTKFQDAFVGSSVSKELSKHHVGIPETIIATAPSKTAAVVQYRMRNSPIVQNVDTVRRQTILPRVASIGQPPAEQVSEGGRKSILKQGRFAKSSNDSKQLRGQDSKSTSVNTSSGGVRFKGSARERLSPHRKRGVPLSVTGTAVQVADPRGPSRGAIPDQEGYHEVLHHPDDNCGRPQHQKGHGRRFFEAEDTLRMQKGPHPPQEFLDQRIRGLMPPQSDPRMGDPQRRSPPRCSLPGHPGPGRAPLRDQHSPASPQNGNIRHLTPQEQQQLARRQQQQLQQQQQTLQQQQHQIQQQQLKIQQQQQLMQQQQKTKQQQQQKTKQQQQPQQQQMQQEKGPRRGLFGRKAATIQAPEMTHYQMRMAAAQAAYVRVEDN